MKQELVNFDIDRYINPWIPRNRLDAIPRPISHFLGYRKEPQKEPATVIVWLSAFIGTLAGLLVVGAVFKYAPGVRELHPPVLIASLGASAVLDYGAIRSPLSQPRNTIIGHTMSAIVGIGISKLFQLNSNFANLEWVSAAVGCACASLVMSMTNGIHPPGGATAVLASVQANVIKMGWWFAAVILLSSTLMTGVALITNNIMRQYPVYWWTAEDVGQNLWHANKDDDIEKGGKGEGEGEGEGEANDGAESDGERTLRKELSNVSFEDGKEVVKITAYQLRLPSHIQLTDEEVKLLEQLQQRLQQHGETG